MPGPYSHKQFFRNVPNVQLQTYFTNRAIPIELDFSELKEKDSDSIFDAFSALLPDQQSNVEAEFQAVHAMASDAGVQALIDESWFHSDETFAAEISTIDGLHAKVMWAFLEKPEYWRGATSFLHADNVSFSYWKKLNDLPAVEPHVEDSDIQGLANAISEYFNRKEGRGKHCKVEPYRRHEKEYFFAYPEDYAQSGVEWVNASLQNRSRHPAFEIIFVYSQHEGSLDIYAPRNSKAVPELQAIFAKQILKLDQLPEGGIDKRVYDLAPLENPQFNFQFEPDSDIASVAVYSLRLTLKNNKKSRIVLEADPTDNPRAVYELLETLDPPPHQITRVGVKVVFEKSDGRRARTRRFNITYPNSCALSYDGDDLKIRKMLAQSGLEPTAFSE